MNKALNSLHSKILKSKFAEEVTEAEIEALVEAKEHKGGWIPCSERLPEEDGVYIISLKEYSGLICCAVAYLTLNHPKWKWWDLENEYEYYEAVIAWQPLPEPYKECEKQ